MKRRVYGAQPARQIEWMGEVTRSAMPRFARVFIQRRILGGSSGYKRHSLWKRNPSISGNVLLSISTCQAPGQGM
jgi:hypothetical protein